MSSATHRVRLAGGDVEFACPADDTLLRAAQRAGLGFPYECNVGACGNCKFELVAGQVSTAWAEAPGLSDKDRQRQRHLGCQSLPLGDCVLKLRPGERYVPPHRPLRVGAALVGRCEITHDISEFHFALNAPLAFEPGQYALVQLPGVNGVRAYSMSNVAMSNTAESAGAATWHFQVRRLPGGVGSAALFALPVGARVQIDGPYGMAWLKRDVARDILCLAGGSGLAPMLSIARAAMVEPRLAARRLHFIYGGRTAADLCGRDELAALPGWGTRLSWHGFVSQPQPADPTQAVAFVHEAALQLLGPQLPQMEVYFAGPPAMSAAVQRMLLDAGVAPAQQHFDAFY